MPRYGVFVYSNFCVSPMSGDLGGERITLRRFADGDTLVYEYTDGSTHAVMASGLALDARSGTLHFEINVAGESKSAISGKFSPGGGYVTLRDLPFRGANEYTLARVTDFAAPLKQCKPLPH